MEIYMTPEQIEGYTHNESCVVIRIGKTELNIVTNDAAKSDGMADLLDSWGVERG